MYAGVHAGTYLSKKGTEEGGRHLRKEKKGEAIKAGVKSLRMKMEKVQKVHEWKGNRSKWKGKSNGKRE